MKIQPFASGLLSHFNPIPQILWDKSYVQEEQITYNMGAIAGGITLIATSMYMLDYSRTYSSLNFNITSNAFSYSQNAEISTVITAGVLCAIGAIDIIKSTLNILVNSDYIQTVYPNDTQPIEFVGYLNTTIDSL